jgi:tetratricopeptide (TPR) repeat protein
MATSAEVLAAALQYHQAGNLAAAEQIYRSIVQAEPREANAWHLLGLVAYQSGKHDEALDLIGRALALAPQVGAFHSNLAAVYIAMGRWEEAAASCTEAVRRHPDSPQFRNNLGNALMQLQQFDGAEENFREALRLLPNHVDALTNLSILLRRQGRVADAVVTYGALLRVRPEDAETHRNLAFALAELQRFEEAEVAFEQALRLNRADAELHNYSGATLQELGKVGDAIAQFERALDLDPSDVQAHVNRGLALLLLGRLEEGWPEYEWRSRSKDHRALSLSLPCWDGSPLAGRTIVLNPEQGLGDTIQFIRYAALVKERGGLVVAAVPPSLVDLVTTCPGVDVAVPKNSVTAPADAVQVLLGSLPGVIKTSLSTVPARLPYLFADTSLVEAWRRKLAPYTGLKVGIVWQGSSANPGDHMRSVPLMEFAPLGRMEGIQLFSLQVGEGREQLTTISGQWSMIDLGTHFNPATFADAAAAMNNLDLVVTVDSALGHLAGALGVPVWVALPFAWHWVWLKGREDTPWYPTMRLFRQPQRGNWPQVFERMASELTKLRQSKRSTSI